MTILTSGAGDRRHCPPLEDEMRHALVGLAFLFALAAPNAWAQDFDADQCSRIENVDVPYEVASAQQAITFSARGGDIVVTPQSIRANGRTHASPAVAGYHRDLSQFLNQASATARAINPLSQRSAGMGEAATDMCRAIITLAASATVIEGEFDGYSSPVRIRLR
jgi:hypothetical protein